MDRSSSEPRAAGAGSTPAAIRSSRTAATAKLVGVVRILVGLVFVTAGLPKLTGHAHWAGDFHHWHVPLAGLAVYLVGSFEVIGGVLLASGVASALIAALFVVDMTGALLFAGLTDGGSYQASAAGAEGGQGAARTWREPPTALVTHRRAARLGARPTQGALPWAQRRDAFGELEEFARSCWSWSMRRSSSAARLWNSIGTFGTAARLVVGLALLDSVTWATWPAAFIPGRGRWGC